MDWEDKLINWLIFGGDFPGLTDTLPQVAYPIGFEPAEEDLWLTN